MSDSLRRLMPVAVVTCALVVVPRWASAQFVQQGSKLVGSGVVGPYAWQGQGVALAADGNTAIVGGFNDNFQVGAAWIWTRSGTTWTQQGNKLVGTGAAGPFGAEQGVSVALSADGNTAIVGGDTDNDLVGATWVFVRSGGTWTQQGAKLVGSSARGGSLQGTAVALSADGNTAIVGGPFDNDDLGAAWIFVRSGGTWTQQGPKLVGTGVTGIDGEAWQGVSVALSADGNTALVGGTADNGDAGAVWAFTRTGGTWTQQGPKLTPTDGAVEAGFGWSLAVSADGNTAAIGGTHHGATWVFTRNGSTWTQQGSKLVGTGAAGTGILQFSAVAISGDGNTIVAGSFDDSDATQSGAAWVFTRANGTWTQFGAKLVGTGAVDGTTGAQQGTGVGLSSDGLTAIVGGPEDNSGVGAAWIYTLPLPISASQIPDMDGDGKSDLAVWRGTTGTWYWLTSSTGYDVAQAGSRQWGNQALGDIPLTGDIDGDGKADLVVWRASTGTWYWLTSSSGFVASGSTQWGAATDVPLLGDIDGDGKADLIIWRPTTGTWYWLTSSSGYAVAAAGSKQWGNQSFHDTPLVGDIDGDGKADLIVWRPSNGTWYWLTSASGYDYANMRTVQWGNSSLGDVPLLGDADGDGKADLIVWRATTGVWYYLTSLTSFDPGQAVRLQFGNQSLGDVPLLGQFDGDRIVDLTVWRASTGTWYWLTSTSNYNPAVARSKQWGNQAVGDVPLQIVVPPMVR